MFAAEPVTAMDGTKSDMGGVWNPVTPILAAPIGTNMVADASRTAATVTKFRVEIYGCSFLLLWHYAECLYNAIMQRLTHHITRKFISLLIQKMQND